MHSLLFSCTLLSSVWSSLPNDGPLDLFSTPSYAFLPFQALFEVVLKSGGRLPFEDFANLLDTSQKMCQNLQLVSWKKLNEKKALWIYFPTERDPTQRSHLTAADLSEELEFSTQADGVVVRDVSLEEWPD